MLTPNSDISAMDAVPHEHAVGDRPDERADDGHGGQRQRALEAFFMPATPQAAGTTPPQTTTPTQNKIARVPAHDAGQKAVGQGGHQRRGRAHERLGGREGTGQRPLP